MFVAAGQTAYMTSASGKAAVVAVFVLNGSIRLLWRVSTKTCPTPRRCST
jgi:hypothetical protein